jgi:VCBS repeat-containing protein
MSGTLVNNGDGTFDYTSDPGFSGIDSSVYEICDLTLLCDTATMTFVVGQATVVETRVAASSDDAEEDLVDGSVSVTSSDLEMIQETNEQIVGIRFVGVDVPQGATIVDAWVQFQADETTSVTTTLTIQGEASDNAATFSGSDLEISSRPRTSVETAASWSPPPWDTVGEAGPDQQTPNIAAVIQEIVSRTGWSSGNSLVILITGSGGRTAESFDGDQAGAPLLHVEFVESSAPVASDDAVSTPVDTPVLIDVAANDTDVDGNLDPTTTNTTCVTCFEPSSGALVNHGDGTFTYTPNPGFGGPDSFVYEICDTDLQCATATVSIAVGEPPEANDDSVTTAEDTPVSIDVAANDTDGDGNLDPATADTTCATCSGPANGSLVNNGNGTVDYTPNANYNGPDSFVYEICDTAGACDTATVAVTVTGVNDSPVANDDSRVTPLNTLITIDVAANDTDVDGNLDPTTANNTCATCSGPSNGTLTNGADGTFDYTPGLDFIGPDDFVYEICDVGGLCAMATVSITVGQLVVADLQIAVGPDDAEETGSGNMQLTSGDLDLGSNSVGLRFSPVNIEPGAAIQSAYVRFTADDTETGSTNLTIRGHDADDAAVFTTTSGDLTSRPRTTALVSWSPSAWTAGQTGPDQQTPDIASVVQEIVNRPGWLEGNAMLFIFTGPGSRTAASFEANVTAAALLHVEFIPGGPQAPTVTIEAPRDSTTSMEGNTVSFSGVATDFEDGDVTASLSWVSDLDGFLGSGASFSRSDLSAGAHTITATATDSGAMTGSDTVSHTVFAATNVLVGAGDIADCRGDEDDLTAVLLDGIAGIVFTLGDNVYSDGTDPEFANCYDPTWGRHKARTKPSVGNHEYNTPSASGYYNYFGAAAGDPAEGWHSYDLAGWHIVALNSNCDEAGGCELASPQGQWLQADLAANPTACTLAYWHHSRFSSGSNYGSDIEFRDFWQVLYEAGADVVLSAHDHHYERFAPQDPDGNADPEGIRQFVVGTGGSGIRPLSQNPEPNSEIGNGDTSGVLKLTLHPTSYEWEFIPLPGFTFTDSGSGSCVGLTNEAPIANDDAYSTGEDGVLTMAPPGVLGNDTDTDGDPLTAVLDIDPSNGTLMLNADGSFDYTPDADFNGSDSFAYFANDGTVNSVISATVSITVNAVNDSPVANDDSATTSENTPVSIDVLANDTDVDGNLDPTSVTVTTAASNGTTSVNSVTGEITYTPNTSYVGGDSFVYQVCDTGTPSLCDTATVTLTVTVTNDPPVANDDGYTTDEDTLLTVPAPGVLGNDTDGDGDPLTAVLDTGPANGSLTFNTDGSFSYTPDADFNGQDSFDYFANDSLVNSVIAATVSITVTAVNDAPVADDQSVSTDEDTAVGITLTASDVDGDPLTYSIVSGPSNGSLSGSPPSVTYTPNADFNGGDSFTFQANDGGLDSNVATVTITVNAVNDSPVADDQSVSTDEDTAVGITLTASDVDGDPLTYSIVSGPLNGALSGTPPSVTYTPNADFNGGDSFTFQANDGSADSNVATVSITVNPVNDPPVANDDSASTPVDTLVVVDVAANDVDVEGLDLSSTNTVCVGCSSPTNGTLLNNGDGTFDYTPNPSYTGGDSFVYEICDNDATTPLCDTATVSSTVTASITTLTVGPTDDAYVDSKKAAANLGSSSILQVKAGSKELDSYLKLSVSGISGTVVSAKLRLFVTKDSPDGGSVYLVSNDYLGGGPWNETGLVWNNAPVIGGVPLATAGAVLTGTWVELEVGGAIAADGTYSFGLSSGSSNAARFSSKEGTNPPELVITFE